MFLLKVQIQILVSGLLNLEVSLQALNQTLYSFLYLGLQAQHFEKIFWGSFVRWGIYLNPNTLL